MKIKLIEVLKRRLWMDNVQTTAWRLVRTAEKRHGGNGTGSTKYEWAVARLMVYFPGLHTDEAGEFVESAFSQFQLEQKAYERSVT